jgi:hypothetical protein
VRRSSLVQARRMTFFFLAILAPLLKAPCNIRLFRARLRISTGDVRRVIER